jgi:hypothetical protein
MSSLEPFEQCSSRLAHLGFQVGQFVDLSEEGRQFHQHNFEAAEAALARPEGEQERAVEILERRMRASRAMEKNIRIGAIRVGLVVSYKN